MKPAAPEQGAAMLISTERRQRRQTRRRRNKWTTFRDSKDFNFLSAGFEVLHVAVLLVLVGTAIVVGAHAQDRQTPSQQQQQQQQQQQTKPPSNATQIRLNGKETANWNASGNASFGGLDTPLVLTDQDYGLDGAAFHATPISRASLARGFRTSFIYRADSDLIVDGHYVGSRGVTLYLGPAKIDGSPPLMYPSAQSQQQPQRRPVSSIEVMFSTAGNGEEYGAPGGASPPEPDEEKVAVYLNHVVDWSKAICKTTVPRGTFTDSQVQVVVAFAPPQSPTNPGPNATLSFWWWGATTAQQTERPQWVCGSSMELNAFFANWTVAPVDDPAPPQLGLLSATLPRTPDHVDPAISANNILSLIMEYCKTYNAFYVEATASMPSFCVCLTGFLLDGTTNACIPVRPSGPVLSPGTIAGIVIGSVVGLGLIGGLLFYLGQRRGKTKAKKASASGATEAQALATAGARTGSSDPGIEMAAPLNFDPSAPPLSVLDEPSGPALEELEEAEAAAMLVNEAPTAMSAARPTVMPSAPPDHEALLVPGTLGSGLAAVAAVSATAPPSNSPPPMAPPRTVSAPPAAVDPILADPPPPPYTEMDPHAVVMNAPSPASVPPAAAPTVPVETVTAQAPSGGAATITPSLAAAAAAVTAPPRTDTAPLIVQEVAAPPRVSSVAGPGTDGAMVGVTELPKPLHMVAHKTFTATRPDEVALSVGDILAVRRLYDDGYAFGANHSIETAVNNNGFFPLAAAKTLTGEAMSTYLSGSN